MPLKKNGTLIRTTTFVAATASLALATPAQASWFTALSRSTPTSATPTNATTTTTNAGQVTTTTTSSGTTSTAVPVPSGCVALPTKKSFQGVDGDTADYSLAPGGDFENGLSGWTVTNGAKIVSRNETIGATTGRSSLQLPLNATATSPSFCIDESNPHFRFAYKVDNATMSGFVAYVIYRDVNGSVTGTELVSSKSISLFPSTWQASPKSPLATIIPLDPTNRSTSVQLKVLSLNPTDFAKRTVDSIIGANLITNVQARALTTASGLIAGIGSQIVPTNVGVTIDSVMVDPYRRG